MERLSTLKSKPITNCQSCYSDSLIPIIYLGSMPPVNEMVNINSIPDAEMRFPLELLSCSTCGLAQIGYEVEPEVLFPHSYPYLSGSTKILRDNFKDLASEVNLLFNLKPEDKIIDIGANDGTLLTPFQAMGHPILGIEPTQAADTALKRGIPTIKAYFNSQTSTLIKEKFGKAKIITAANVFAHIKDVHEVIKEILHLLEPKGIFISESHYLLDLIETLQYDTIYHEHLRYYSLSSLIKIFEQHNLEVIRLKRIPTHGGSIRVYTARKGDFPIDSSVKQCLTSEQALGVNNGTALQSFQKRILQSKLELLSLVCELKRKGARIYGIGAPSRASTLINYVGLDADMLDCIVEISSSPKVGKYIPGTRIPVLDEKHLYSEQPEYALLCSWHIAEELIENLRKKGFTGSFIVPLPKPHIIGIHTDSLSKPIWETMNT